MNSFNERCYALLRTVPRGRVTTYAAIAHALGTRAYRAVGNAMNKNPYPSSKVPCHRVVNSDGRLGGYAKPEEIKIRLLAGEGITIEGGMIVNFTEKLYTF